MQNHVQEIRAFCWVSISFRVVYFSQYTWGFGMDFMSWLCYQNAPICSAKLIDLIPDGRKMQWRMEENAKQKFLDESRFITRFMNSEREMESTRK